MGYYVCKYNNTQSHKDTTMQVYYIGLSFQTDLVGIKYGKCCHQKEVEMSN